MALLDVMKKVLLVTLADVTAENAWKEFWPKNIMNKIRRTIPLFTVG